MRRFLKKLFLDRRGQGMVEYALIISLIAVVSIGGLTAMNGGLTGVFEKIRGQIEKPEDVTPVDMSFIRFDPDGGTVIIPEIVGEADTSVVGALETPTYVGRVFGGWYTEKNGAGLLIATLPEKFPTGGVTYYAKWTLESHNITFDYNGNGTSNVVVAYDYGTKITAPAAPTRTNHSFDGWYNGATLWDFNNTVGLTDITLTAHWTLTDTSVAFVTDGTPVTGSTGTIGNLINPAVVGATSSKTGYTFGGWYTAPNGGGSLVPTLPTYYPVGDMTYHAYFTADDITITFDSGDPAQTFAPITHKADETGYDTSLPVPAPRAGYTFDGWWTEP